MNKFILLFTAFAMIVSATVCASHAAHASVDTDTEISISIDADSSEDTSLGSNGSDMACDGCCIHHAMSASLGVKALTVTGKNKMLLPDTPLFVSDLIYGLKRPPKA